MIQTRDPQLAALLAEALATLEGHAAAAIWNYGAELIARGAPAEERETRLQDYAADLAAWRDNAMTGIMSAVARGGAALN